MPLNAECSHIFMTKTLHLNENDFVEIDRSMLTMIGFKNIWVQHKDKHGNAKVDENGNLIWKDKRSDFSNGV